MLELLSHVVMALDVTVSKDNLSVAAGTDDGICCDPEVELSDVESSSASPVILPTCESNEEMMPLNFHEQLSPNDKESML